MEDIRNSRMNCLGGAQPPPPKCLVFGFFFLHFEGQEAKQKKFGSWGPLNGGGGGVLGGGFLAKFFMFMSSFRA